MTGIRVLNSSAGTRSGVELPRKKAPRLILGLGISGLAAAVDLYFRNLGWDVTRSSTVEEAGRIAQRMKATAVVLPLDGHEESGLLTCAKLRLARPNTRIVLLGPEDGRMARFARFAGAVGYLPEGAGVAAIVRAVTGM